MDITYFSFNIYTWKIAGREINRQIGELEA